MSLIELAVLFRALNLYSHHAHNVCKGPQFLQDHAFLGEIYPLADSFYDDLIERHIGTLSDKIDLNQIIQQSAELVSHMNDKYLDTILILLEESCSAIDNMCKDDKLSVGTQNLIQGQADQIEVLIYKTKRRLK